jgi:hypothetical protein
MYKRKVTKENNLGVVGYKVFKMVPAPRNSLFELLI